ncbi:MAG: hypothetical protein NTX21_10225 [Alphaproteobacteria bacterium]|nr:hypothetical protein [Alphaproteobacteria bacterium]
MTEVQRRAVMEELPARLKAPLQN